MTTRVIQAFPINANEINDLDTAIAALTDHVPAQTVGGANYKLLVSDIIGLVPKPYDVAAKTNGTLSANQIVMLFAPVRDMNIAAGFSGSRAISTVAATSSATFTIYKNLILIGTMTFAIGATTATFSVATSTTLTTSDYLEIIAPTTPDLTLANISITIKGTQIQV